MAGPWEKYANLSSNEAVGPWAKYQEPKSTGPTKMESAVRGIAQGGLLGYADELAGAGGAIADIASGKESIENVKGAYQKNRDESRQKFKAAKDANPKTYLAGEVGAGVGTLLIPGMNGVTAGRLLAQGAAVGLGNSDSESYLGNIRDAAVGAGTGLVLGKGLPVVTNLVGKGANAVSSGVANKLSDVAEIKAARALGLERSTLKSLGKEKVKEIGRYALDNKIVTPLANAEKMASRNATVKDAGGKMMGQVYDAIDEVGASNFNPKTVAGAVDKKIGDFWRSPLNRGETNQFQNTLDSILMRGEKNISLKEAQILKEELGKVANWKNKLTITDKEKMAREAYGVVNDAIDAAVKNGSEVVEKAGLSNTLAQGKKLYSGAKGAEQLLENRIAREEGNKMFGLTDTVLMGGGGAGALASASPEAALLTAAAIGTKKFGEKFGNQIMASGANAISKGVRKAPDAINKVSARPDVINRAIANPLTARSPKLVPSASSAELVNSAVAEETSKPLKGESLWAQRGIEKLGLSEDEAAQILNSKQGKQLLIEASDLPANSKKLQQIRNQLQGRSN